MKVNIKGQPNSSLLKDIGDIELAPLTIFAGLNNAGKTKLVEAIGEELEEKGMNVIDIPAERVLVAPEIKTGNETDPLRSALNE